MNLVIFLFRQIILLSLIRQMSSCPKLNTDLYFNNFRLEKETNLQSLTLQWVLALILCISGFLVTTLIRLGICISARQAEGKPL